MTANVSTVGLLHPGSMGAAFAAQLRFQGIPVLWCRTGRSNASRRRADRAGIEAVDDLGELLRRVDVVLSLCPPEAAEDVAAQVGALGFQGGTYIEANAITPLRVRRIADRLPHAVVVDGAVVGSPPLGGKQPTLYLSGPSEHVAQVEALFRGTDIRAHCLGEEIGKASALKLAYSSYQKASRVLAAVAYGLADSHGVADELLEIASKRSGSYLAETDYIPKAAARAWRWGPELGDAADLLAEAGLPDHLMRAATEVLHLWESARDRTLTVDEALRQLCTEGQADHEGGTGTTAER